jgi:hypothetical protein
LVDQGESSTWTSSTVAVPGWAGSDLASKALRRALGGQLAVDHVDSRDLHRHAGAEAGGEAGTDLEAEQAAAEDGVLVALVAHDLGHHVDHRLGQALGRLGAEDLRDAVGAERRREVVGHGLADDDRVGLATDLSGQLRGLRDGAERVLVDRAVVVQRVDQDVGHQISFLSSSQATIFSTVSLVSSSSMIVPPDFCGGSLNSPHCTAEPSVPTCEGSMPTSPADRLSSCFFFAPMIALSDG